MKKKELMKQIEEAKELTNGKTLNMRSIAFIILKTLELKEAGLTSNDFYEKTLKVE